jgi:Tfp pilus assembly protein PilO
MNLQKFEHKVAALASAAAVLVIVVWFMAFWRPEGSSLRSAEKAESQAAAQVASDEAQIATLRADAPMVAKDKAVLEKLVEELPYGPSLDQMLVTINRAAAAAGVTLSSVGTPEPSGWGTPAGSSSPVTVAGPQSITISLGVTGTPARVLRFVSALDAQTRLYVVSSFSLNEPPAGRSVVSTSLSVEGFFQSAASENPVFPGK